MKAILWTKYGSPDSLQLMDIPKPVPSDDEILVKILATTVTAGDTEMRRLKLPLMLSFPMRLYLGLLKPKRVTILGQELAGIVEEVGKNVKSYREGDQVFGTTGFGFGAYAEHICLKGNPNEVQGTLAIKPVNMSFEEAAAVPTAGFEALHFLRHSNIQVGQKVLIFGAGGSIGTFSVQLAKHFGAEVTCVDSTRKMDMLRSIGADHVIDYTQEDFTENGQQYDLIFDVKTSRSVFDYKRALCPNGTYVTVGGKTSRILQVVLFGFIFRKYKFRMVGYKPNKDSKYIVELFQAGKLKPFIDKCFPLEETTEAFRYYGEGRFKGKIVITLEHNGGTL